MDVPDRRTRGRAAIRSVARDRDLPTDLTILSERWNTVALLGDSGVVARAATLSDLACEDPLAVSGREVETCRELARRGAPVAAPIGEVTQIEGVPVSLWERVDGVMGEASEDERGVSLWKGAFQRLVRNPSAIVGAVIVALFVLVIGGFIGVVASTGAINAGIGPNGLPV